MPIESFPSSWKEKELKDEEEGRAWLFDKAINAANQERMKSEALERLAEERGIDSVTGIWPRVRFEGEFKKLFQQPLEAEHRGTPPPRPPGVVTIFLGDVDNFKKINDGYGHAIGDEVLKGVAKQLPGFAREGDLIGRWGGEEFIMAFPGAHAEDVMKRLPQKAWVDEKGRKRTAGEIGLKIKPEKLSEYGDQIDVDVTISGGFMEFAIPKNCSPEEALRILHEACKNADELLYEAKRTGKNKILMNETPVRSSS